VRNDDNDDIGDVMVIDARRFLHTIILTMIVQACTIKEAVRKHGGKYHFRLEDQSENG